MRILHLFSNWKWTGPAEPALNLAWAQVRSGAHEVLFLSGTPPSEHDSRIDPQAEERGVPVAAGFHLTKHASWRKNREDVERLAALMLAFRPDIVHAHMNNDHRVASLAVRRAGLGRLVRTCYDAEGLAGSLRVRRVARRALDGLIITSAGAKTGTLARYGGSTSSVSVASQPRPMALIEGGIDVTRFDPGRFDRAAERERLGLSDDDVGLGIVARVQGHRRFEILLGAFQRVAESQPRARLVVIGRGTHIKPLLLDPVKDMGLSDRVLTTGYLRGDEFPGALVALDVSLFLVPGSDGTCRALREQMCMGLPSLVTPRAPLPDIVEAGVTGLVVDESIDGLAHGMERMVGEDALRKRLAEGSLAAARRRFDLDGQARAVDEFYAVVLRDRPLARKTAAR